MDNQNYPNPIELGENQFWAFQIPMHLHSLYAEIIWKSGLRVLVFVEAEIMW